MTTKTYALTGNEIVARAAVDAGCRFYAGYPISPSSEIAAYMAKLLPPVGGAFIQMEDEIASMAATIGGSLTGKKSMTATSGPGFSLKQENLGYACMTEVPCVIVNVMRCGPSTGMPTLPSQGDIMQAKWGTHGDHPIITLYPTFHDEIYTETVRAFNLAEKYRTPVVLLTDEVLSHMSARIDIPDASELVIEHRPRPAEGTDKRAYKPYDESFGDIPPMADFFTGYYWHVTGLTHDETGFPTEDRVKAQRLADRLERKLQNNLDDILKYEEFMLDDAEIVIVACGSVGRSAKQAVIQAREEFGLKVGMFRPLTIWPFPEEPLKRIAAGKREIIVTEMNMGQLSLEVERVLQQNVTRVLKYNGDMLTADDILARLTQTEAEKQAL